MEELNMKSLSKLCDAADWFDPEVDEIIRVELREPARLHRKQWEFALIFLVLRRLGLVRPDTVGLSLGGGTERLLYSLAHHIKHMTVTDLYDPNTTWDCARTENPDEFVRSQKPFDVDDSKYHALRMDMRSLDFPDRSFDFCYSSCAIEHIGDDADFIRHFNEVARVLKHDGVYVLTTEVSYLSQTIRDPNNYVFSPDYLVDLFARSNLEPIFDCDARITHNRTNVPLPWEVLQHVADNGSAATKSLIESIPHITLLRARYPFGSGLFTLRKKQRGAKLKFVGLENLTLFMRTSIEKYNDLLTSLEKNAGTFFSIAESEER
jgi:SAM-dependent methyltransferase